MGSIDNKKCDHWYQTEEQFINAWSWGLCVLTDRSCERYSDKLCNYFCLDRSGLEKEIYTPNNPNYSG